MNEPRHIRETTIRMLESRIRALTLRIDELVKAKGPWKDIEALMTAREEYTKILDNIKSNES